MTWLLGAWSVLLWVGCAYWFGKARRAESRATFWQDECRRVVSAQADAEHRAIAANAERDRVVAAYRARIDQDRVIANMTRQARRLH